MSDFTLVPVDHQPDFSNISLVPVDHDPFSADGASQPAQPQPVQNQPAQPQPAQNQPKSLPPPPAMGPEYPDVSASLIGDGGQFFPNVPWASKSADIAVKLVGNAFRGAVNLVVTPGAIMRPNPYPPDSEEAYWYEDQRQRAMYEWPPAMALAMLGAGAPMAARGALGALGGKPLPSGGSLGRGIAAAEGRAAAVVKDELPTKAPTDNSYDVLFEMRLKPTSYPGVSRKMHNREGNEALLQEIERDAAYARVLQNQGIDLRRTPTGLAPREPAGFSWHYREEPGVLQLVPREQHEPGSIYRDILHPKGEGGYIKWDK